MSDWLEPLLDARARGAPGVLVTVAEARGSTPREAGARMLVGAAQTWGTIGGGNLEYKAIEIARELLARPARAGAELRRFPLGPSLGQCCGGVAVLLFEPLADARWAPALAAARGHGAAAVLVSDLDAPAAGLVVSREEVHGECGDAPLQNAARARALEHLARGAGAILLALPDAHGELHRLLLERLPGRRVQVMLFGAGHVGRALVSVLGTLECRVHWVDSRVDPFPAALPGNVRTEWSDRPEALVDDAPPGCCYLIMTHSHPLDQAILERVLRRADFAYCGLIGSRSKRARFEKRLRAAGIDPAALARLTCPIGVPGIRGKRPAEIAVAVAAQLLQERDRAPAERAAPASAVPADAGEGR